jgi:hypothetical protein
MILNDDLWFLIYQFFDIVMILNAKLINNNFCHKIKKFINKKKFNYIFYGQKLDFVNFEDYVLYYKIMCTKGKNQKYNFTVSYPVSFIKLGNILFLTSGQCYEGRLDKFDLSDPENIIKTNVGYFSVINELFYVGSNKIITSTDKYTHIIDIDTLKKNIINTNMQKYFMYNDTIIFRSSYPDTLHYIPRGINVYNIEYKKFSYPKSLNPAHDFYVQDNMFYGIHHSNLFVIDLRSHKNIYTTIFKEQSIKYRFINQNNMDKLVIQGDYNFQLFDINKKEFDTNNFISVNNNTNLKANNNYLMYSYQDALNIYNINTKNEKCLLRCPYKLKPIIYEDEKKMIITSFYNNNCDIMIPEEQKTEILSFV